MQYRCVVYTDRLDECAAVASVGSPGDSYDNALAEAFNSLYKAELIYHTGLWAGLADVEAATAGYVAWLALHGCTLGWAIAARLRWNRSGGASMNQR